ncbi:4-hydroxybenzoate 3-monooxygenase [Catenulispora yoronensis]
MVILGAGPAGLVLANLLHQSGIDCVVLERASREHVETRARAGYLAPETVRILERHGLADGLRARGREHDVCEFRTPEGRFRLRYGGLGRGEPHTVYPQQSLVSDLIAEFTAAGGRIAFETEARSVTGVDGDRPTVLTHDLDGRPTQWPASYVAGCDGRHGAARRAIPAADARRRHSDHGVSWLAVLVAAPASMDAVGYAVHREGFAGHMSRGPETTRYYLQCDRGTATDSWSEDRIWSALAHRLRADEYGPLREGPVLERGIVHLESDVLRPLRHGSLFLVGDAASLVSPSAAKGANLAVLEAEILAQALAAAVLRGDPRPLLRYSDRCLSHIWRAQEFSHWMIRLLHAPTAPQESSGFHDSLRYARLESLRTSRSHQDWFAENYVGL